MIRNLMAISLVLLCVRAPGAVAEPRGDETSPGLSAEHFTLSLRQDDALARAEQAIRAAGLTPLPPTSISRGGVSRFVNAMIRCIDVSPNLLADVTVANTAGHGSEGEVVRNFLVTYMKTGRPPTSAGDPGQDQLAGEWTQDIAGFGRSLFTLAPLEGLAYQYQFRQSGSWNATGTARFLAGKFRIDWTTPAGWAGYSEFPIIDNRISGRGMTVVTKGDRPGSYPTAIGKNTTTAPPSVVKDPGLPGPALAPPGYEGKQPILSFGPIIPGLKPGALPPLGADHKVSGAPVTSPAGLEPLKIVRLRLTRKPFDFDPNARGQLAVDVELSRPPKQSECEIDLYIGGYVYINQKEAWFCDAYRHTGLVMDRLDTHYSGAFDMPQALPARVRAELIACGTKNVIDHVEESFTYPYPDVSVPDFTLFGDNDLTIIRAGMAVITGAPDGADVSFSFEVPNKDLLQKPNLSNNDLLKLDSYSFAKAFKYSGIGIEQLPIAHARLGLDFSGSVDLVAWTEKDRPAGPPGVSREFMRFEVSLPGGVLDFRKVFGFYRRDRGYDPKQIVNLNELR